MLSALKVPFPDASTIPVSQFVGEGDFGGKGGWRLLLGFCIWFSF